MTQSLHQADPTTSDGFCRTSLYNRQLPAPSGTAMLVALMSVDFRGSSTPGFVG